MDYSASSKKKHTLFPPEAHQTEGQRPRSHLQPTTCRQQAGRHSQTTTRTDGTHSSRQTDSSTPQTRQTHSQKQKQKQKQNLTHPRPDQGRGRGRTGRGDVHVPGEQTERHITASPTPPGLPTHPSARPPPPGPSQVRRDSPPRPNSRRSRCPSARCCGRTRTPTRSQTSPTRTPTRL